MKESDVRRFEKLLLAEKERVSSSIRVSVGDLAQHTSAQKGDEGDEAQALFETYVSLRFGERGNSLLDKIDAALERIRDGSFGVCEDCGEDINLKRLEIRPVASLCVPCKEAREKHEGKFDN